MARNRIVCLTLSCLCSESCVSRKSLNVTSGRCFWTWQLFQSSTLALIDWTQTKVQFISTFLKLFFFLNFKTSVWTRGTTEDCLCFVVLKDVARDYLAGCDPFRDKFSSAHPQSRELFSWHMARHFCFIPRLSGGSDLRVRVSVIKQQTYSFEIWGK